VRMRKAGGTLRLLHDHGATTRMRATTLVRIMFVLKLTRVTASEHRPFGIVATVAPATRVPICSGCMCRARWPTIGIARVASPRCQWHGDDAALWTFDALIAVAAACARVGSLADHGLSIHARLRGPRRLPRPGATARHSPRRCGIASRTVGSIVAPRRRSPALGDSLAGLEHIASTSCPIGSTRVHHRRARTTAPAASSGQRPGKNAATLRNSRLAGI